MQNKKRKEHSSFNSLVCTPLVLNIWKLHGETAQQNILILWQRDLETLKVTAMKPSCCYRRKRFSGLLQRSNASVILHKSSRLLPIEEKGFMLNSAIQGIVH